MNAQSVTYIADGSTAVFDFPFPVFEPLEIEVVVDGTIQVSGFTLRGDGGNHGGAVRFDTAPASGQTVILRRTGKVQVSGTDAPGFLEAKLVAGTNIAITPTTDANGEHLVIATTIATGDFLLKAQNLADLTNAATARSNLGLAAVAASGSYTDLSNKPVLGSAAAHSATDFATAAQGAKADSALQSSDIGVSVQAHGANLDWLAANLSNAGKALVDDADASAQRATLGLATVAATGSYTDLSNKPALGSAAAHSATDFATAAQGAKADTALQSSDIGVSVQAHGANLDWLASSLSTAGKALVDDADASAQRATLGLATVAATGSYTDLSNKPALGTAAALNVGTGANQVVQLDSNAKLPAVDGSQVTNLSAGNLTTGTVATARLGSGTAGSDTFLRGDQTWQSMSSVGGAMTVFDTIVANNVSSIQFTGFEPGYDYIVNASNFTTNGTVGVNCQQFIQCGYGTGPTWGTASTYLFLGGTDVVNAAPLGSDSNGVPWLPTGNYAMNSDPAYPSMWRLRCSNPDFPHRTGRLFELLAWGYGSSYRLSKTYHAFAQEVPVTGLKILGLGVNFSGTYTCYAIKRS